MRSGFSGGLEPSCLGRPPIRGRVGGQVGGRVGGRVGVRVGVVVAGGVAVVVVAPHGAVVVALQRLVRRLHLQEPGAVAALVRVMFLGEATVSTLDVGVRRVGCQSKHAEVRRAIWRLGRRHAVVAPLDPGRLGRLGRGPVLQVARGILEAVDGLPSTRRLDDVLLDDPQQLAELEVDLGAACRALHSPAAPTPTPSAIALRPHQPAEVVVGTPLESADGAVKEIALLKATTRKSHPVLIEGNKYFPVISFNC